jgi:hypothetical protein
LPSRLYEQLAEFTLVDEYPLEIYANQLSVNQDEVGVGERLPQTAERIG